MDRRDVRRFVALELFPDKFAPPMKEITAASSTATTNMTAGTYLYAMSYGYSEGESDLGPITSVTLTATASVALSTIDHGDPRREIYSRNLWRTTNGGNIFYLLNTFYQNDPATTTHADGMTDASLLGNGHFRTMIGDLHLDDMNQMIDDVNKDVAIQTKCLQYTATNTTVDGQANYTMPSNALKPFGQNVHISVDGFECLNTTPQNLDQMFPQWRDVSSGTSRWWYVEQMPGTEYKLYPPPDTSGDTIRLHYPGLPTTLSNDSSEMLDGLYTHRHRLVVNGVVAKYKARAGDMNPMVIYQSEITDFRKEVAQNKISTDMKVYIPYSNMQYRTTRYDPFFNRR